MNADGTLDTGFNPDADGTVNSVAVQADGKILLGGFFSTVGGVTRNRIARVNANGTLDTGFNPNVGGTVFGVAIQADGKILLGGDFTTVGGVTRNRIARVNADGTLDTGFNPNVNNRVIGVAVQADGKILLVGFFNSVGVVTTRNQIARVNADGTLDTGFNPDAGNSGTVVSVAVQADGKVLLGGGFNTVGGVTRNGIARVNADGTLDTGFNPNAGGGSVLSVAVQADGKILLGGTYTTVGGVARNRIALLVNDPATQTLTVPDTTQVFWTRTGSAAEVQDVTFELSINGGTSYTPLGAGNRIPGGWVISALNLPANGQVRARGRTFSGQFNGSSSGLVEQVASFTGVPVPLREINLSGNGVNIYNGDSMPAGADLTDFGVAVAPSGTVSRTFTITNPGSAALGLTGTVPDYVTVSGLGAAQFSVTAQPASASVAAGGTKTFTVRYAPTALGTHSATVNIASDDVDENPFTFAIQGTGVSLGEVDPAFNPDSNGMVYSVAVQADGKVLMGGTFTTVGGVTRIRIARLNADGTLDTGFNPNADGTVNSVAVQADGKILLGGSFTTVGGGTRNRIARVNADGTLDTGFNPDADGTVNSVAVQADGKILLGGFFSTVGGVTRNRIARVNADGTLDTGFNPNADGTVFGVAIQADGKILLGGDFTTVGGVTRNRIARVNADGTLDTGFNPNVNNRVIGVAVQADGKILLVGFFNSVGVVTTRNQIARVNADGTLDTGFNPDAGNSGTVVSVAVQADGKVLLGGGFNTVGGVTRNGIARVNADGTLDTGFNPNAGGGSVLSVAVQADGKILLGGTYTTVGGVARNRIALLVNDPATQTLTVPDTTQVFWTRTGSAAEVQDVTFELSINGGTSYTPLGAGNRIPGGWVLSALNLPANGQVRARGRTFSGQFNGSSSGLIEQVTSFTGLVPPAPTVTNVAPSSGPAAGGTSVTITGTNFTGATAVSFGTTAATSYTVDSPTQITATTPAHAAGAVSVDVTTAGGTNAANTLFTYVAPPTVTNVAPSSGTTGGGTSVTITGTNLTGATAVTFGGIAATGVTVDSATQITATTPAHAAGAVSVDVTTPGGTNAANTLYTYVSPVVLSGGDLTVNMPLAGSNTIIVSVSGPNLVISDGTTSQNIPLASITGSITINGGSSDDTIIFNNMGTITNAVIANGGAGTDSIAFNDVLTSPAVTATAETITVGASGLVKTSSGNLTLTAANGVTINGTVDSLAGILAIDADSDANGTGTLTVGATGNTFGTTINVLAGDVDINATANVGRSVGTPFTSSVFANLGALPYFIDFDSSGNLYVADYTNGGLKKVTPAGVVSTVFSGGPLTVGTAVDAAGNIYISGAGNIITKVTPGGSVSTFATVTVSLHDLTFDTAGNLYTAGYGGDRIEKVTPAGVVSTFVNGGLGSPIGLAFDSQGNLIVADYNGAVKKVSPSGVVTTLASGLGILYGVAVDAYDNIFVSENGTGLIRQVLPGGGTTVVASGLSSPMGLAFDSAGNLFVAEHSVSRIGKLTAAGTATTQLSIRASQTGRPIDLGTNTSGAIGLTDAELDRVRVAGTGALSIGDATSGTITISAAISPAGYNLLDIQKGVTFSATGGFASDIASGSVYEKLKANGAITIDPAATLTATAVGGFVPAAADSFKLIENISGSGTTGTFAGKAQGATVAVGGVNKVITYTADPGGNDVLLEGTAPSATLASGNLTINMPGSGSHTLTISVSGPNLVINDGTTTQNILLASITGSITINGSPVDDTITFGNMGAIINAVIANGDAGTDSIAFNNVLTSPAVTATAETITVGASGVVKSSNGNLTLTAVNGITINGTVDSLAGILAIDADSDANGTGTLTVGATGGAFGTTINVLAADVDVNATANVGRSVTPTFPGSVFANLAFSPYFIDFDASGNLYVADYTNGALKKVTTAGAVSTVAAGPLGGVGTAVDAAGNIYLSSAGPTVWKITPGGSVSTFASVASVHDMTFDSAGNLYTAGYSSGLIQKVTPGGSVSTFVSSGVGSPIGLAFDSQGNLIVADYNGTVKKVTPAGAVSTLATGLTTLYGVAVDAYDHIFVSETFDGRIQQITSGGGKTLVATGLNDPKGIAFDSSGNLYVADSALNRIVKLTPAGTVTTQLSIRASQTGRPIDLGTNTSGAIGLTDAELDRLNVSSTGTLSIGDATSGTITFSAAISPAGYKLLDIQKGVAFSATGGFSFDITSATVYEQLKVNGPVSIDPAATLTVTAIGGFIPTAGDTFKLIDNISGSSTTGSFSGKPQGTVVAVGGVNKVLSYVGGTGGNDLTLSEPLPPITNLSGGDLAITLPSGGTNALSISVSGPNLVISDGVTTQNIPLASITGAITINGSSSSDTITFGNLGTLPNPIVVDGGSGTDAVNFNGTATVPTLTATAETITVGGSGVVTTTGGDILLTATGDVTINGTVNSGSNSVIVIADSDADGSGSLVAGSTGVVLGAVIDVKAADVSLNGTSSVGSSTTTSVVLKQSVNGRPIDLGSNTSGSVGLTDTELDRITVGPAGSVVIGDTNSGAVSISGVISPLNYKLLDIKKGVAFTATGGFSSDVTSATVYEQLKVNGPVTIDPAATLAVTALGGFVPTSGDTFKLIDNISGSSTTGSFSGKPQNAAVAVGGVNKPISYTAGTGGNDVVLLQTPTPPTGTVVGGDLIVNFPNTGGNPPIIFSVILPDLIIDDGFTQLHIPLASITGSIIINGSAGDDNIVIGDLGTLGIPLVIDGGPGTDTVTFTGIVTAPSINVTAEVINVNSTAVLTTTTGDLVLTATDGININGTVDSGTHSLIINADSDANGSGSLVAGSTGVLLGAVIDITAADIDLNATSTVGSSTTNSVTLRQSVNGRPIDLGSNTGGSVGLTDAELDRITVGPSGSLIIGDANSGPITISAVISPLNYTLLDIQKGASFTATGGFASDIASATVYEQMRVNGALVIDPAATLTATAIGGYVPAGAAAFKLIDNVSNSTTTGSFAGKPQDSTVPVGGVNKLISYTANPGGNDLLLGPLPPTSTLTGGDLVINLPGSGGSSSVTVTVVGPDLVISDGVNTLVIPLSSITGSITINGGAGDDTINIGDLGTLGVPLVINGGPGTDTVNFTGVVTAPTINVTAEIINVTSTAILTTTAGDLTLTATDGVTINGTVDSGSHSLVINADSDANGSGSLVAGSTGVLLGAVIDITAADIDLNATSTVGSSTTNSVTLRQSVNGRPIDLGSNTGGSVGLTDAELDRITVGPAGSLIIGDANSGPITISAVISPLNYTLLDIQRGVTFTATGGFASDITSATVYEQIRANGPVVIDPAATLTVTALGGFVPTPANTFNLIDNVSNSTTTGSFSGKPEGAIVPVGGMDKALSYVAGTGGNDVVLLRANHAPTDITLTPSSLAENNAGGATVGSLAAVDSDVGDVQQFTFANGTGSTDNNDFTITGSVLKINVTADFEMKSSYFIRVQADDGFGGLFEKALTVSITNENEQPTALALVGSTVAENSAADTAVGTFNTTDPDAANTFTYTLVGGTGGADNGNFNIIGDSLRANAGIDFEAGATRSIRVRTTDQGGLFTEDTFTITVTNVNEAPSGSDRTVTAMEDVDFSFFPADFGFTDPNDSPPNALQGVKIAALPPAGTLRLNGAPVSTGEFISVADINAGGLRFTPDLNANGNAYANFTFQVQDNGGTANGGIDLDPTPNNLTIHVTPVNDAPSGTDNTVTTLEDVDHIFTSADFGFTDPNDSPPNALQSVKITTLPGAGTLKNNGVPVSAGDSILVVDVNAGGLRFTPALNANGNGYANFTFQVQDDGGTADGGIDLDPTPNALTINVTPVNDEPTALALAGSTVNENVPLNTTIGTFSTTDVDVGDTFTYTLVSGTGSTNNGDFNISGSTLITNAGIDFEAGATRSIRVRTTDQGGLFTEDTFTITVTNKNEVPSFATGANQLHPFQTSGAKTVTGWATSIDDGDSTVTQSLTFNVNVTSGASIFSTPPAIDASTGTLTYTLSGTSGTASITVTITDDNTINGDAALTSPGQLFNITVEPTPNYTVLTSGNAIVVVELSSNGDTLEISQPSAGNILFAAAGRTFSVDGGLQTTGDSGSIPLAGATSITVNAAGGNDTINLGAFTAALPSLSISGGTGDDTVNLNGDITFASNANLDLDLQNDDPSPGVDTLNVAANANLITSGTAPSP